MSWRISIYFIFLFYYTCNGQNVLVSLKDQLANAASKQKLSLNRGTEDSLTSIKTLKAKMPYADTQMPSQWAQEPETPYHWPPGEVRYYIDRQSYDEGVAKLLGMAFDLIMDAGHSPSCPAFVELDQPGDDEGDWLHFTNPDRVRPCVHEPGFSRGGEIKIVLGYDCLKPREVLHTVLHGFGFRDEITHPKRDLFLRIMWENIQPAFRSMFRVQSMGAVNSLAEYDPMSIMHFHDHAYSINGQATVTPVLPGLKIEPSDGLSPLDKMKIRSIFGHECKKQEIGKILSTCGQNNNLDINRGILPLKDDTVGVALCGIRNRSRITSDDKIVIPGNDVESEKEDESENKGAMVVPGNDVEVKSETEGGDEGGHDGAIVVVPGNDVEVKSENEGGHDEVAIPGGNYVEPEGVGSDVGNPHNDAKNKKIKLAANEGIAHSSDEAIIVGYDSDNKKDMATNSIAGKKTNNKLLAYKLSANGNAGWTMPDEEAVIVGYNAESENNLRRRRRQ